jgi:parvulin-like peptidyl-prolyl isomerase
LAKKKQEKPRRELTRRQRSRRQQQKRRQRIIFGIAILVVVAVLGVVGVGVYNGWYVKDYKPLHETVLEVNGTKFNMEYYVTMLDYFTKDMDPSYVPYMTDYVTQAIERDELVKQEATALGITVSDEEVKELLASMELPQEKAFRDLAATQLLLQKVRDEYLDEQVPKSADQRHVLAMFLESEAQANEVIARIEAGESFTEIAAELSLDDITKEAEGDLGWLPQGILPLTVGSDILEESAFSDEVGTLSQPIYEEDKTKSVGYWLIEVISIDDSVDPVQAQVRRMLLGSEQEALDIRERLEAGEDFAELALGYSLDSASSAQGGEITVSPDSSTTAFEDYVFSEGVELGVLSQPIRDTEVSSTGGYWLIEVTESEANRQISDDNRLILKNHALNDWLEGLKDDPDNVIVNNLNDENIQWAILYVMGG